MPRQNYMPMYEYEDRGSPTERDGVENPHEVEMRMARVRYDLDDAIGRTEQARAQQAKELADIAGARAQGPTAPGVNATMKGELEGRARTNRAAREKLEAELEAIRSMAPAAPAALVDPVVIKVLDRGGIVCGSRVIAHGVEVEVERSVGTAWIAEGRAVEVTGPRWITMTYESKLIGARVVQRGEMFFAGVHEVEAALRADRERAGMDEYDTGRVIAGHTREEVEAAFAAAVVRPGRLELMAAAATQPAPAPMPAREYTQAELDDLARRREAKLDEMTSRRTRRAMADSPRGRYECLREHTVGHDHVRMTRVLPGEIYEAFAHDEQPHVEAGQAKYLGPAPNLPAPPAPEGRQPLPGMVALRPSYDGPRDIEAVLSYRH